MKTFKVLIFNGLVLAVLSASNVLAETVNFNVTATIPAASGISIVATENEIVNGNEVFGPTVTEFNFDPMSFDAENGIYTSDHFFAINVAATGGAGSPDVTVSYGQQSNPGGQVKGLDFKSTVTFTKVTGGPAPQDQEEILLAAHGPIKLMNQIAGGEQIDEGELANGFLRMRVGIYDGANASLNAAGGEPFTNADQSGAYTGVFTVTAVID